MQAYFAQPVAGCQLIIKGLPCLKLTITATLGMARKEAAGSSQTSSRATAQGRPAPHLVCLFAEWYRA